jgi:hypothetical protein
MGPQYGYKDLLCSYLSDGQGGYLTGWPALVAFNNWTVTHYGASFAGSCYYSSVCLSSGSYSGQWSDSTTWVWQCCNQVAYWQAAYPGSLRRWGVSIGGGEGGGGAPLGIG